MRKKSVLKTIAPALVAVITVGVLVGGYFVMAGVSARPQPSTLEVTLARMVRNLAIGWHAAHQSNPVPHTEDAVAQGRAHFADHCASCHANDGSGDTEMGRGLYPRAPDMRLAATQKLADHELFYIIENGIRLTGMPAWGTGTKDGEEESWRLVHFIRHLPQMTPQEMEQMEDLNPNSPAEIRQRIEEQQFLAGGSPETPASPATHQH